MNERGGRKPGPVAINWSTDNWDRVEYAKASIEEMALEAVQNGRNGTISVEIPVKEGRLGRVKRLQITFQSR